MEIQEKESYKQEQRWRSVQVQLNNFRDELEADRNGPNGDTFDRGEVYEPSQRIEQVSLGAWSEAPPPRVWGGGSIPKFEENDDIEQYLTTFERLATAYRWPRADWAVHLVPHLTGKARGAYVAMDLGESMNYDKVRAKYEINEEMYRLRFRDPDHRPGETPRELYNRLKDLYKKWIKPSKKTVEQIGEILILEQYLRTLSPEVRVWVKEHNPKTGQEAADLVEAFIAARRGPKAFRNAQNNRHPPARGKSVGFGGSGHTEGGRGPEEGRSDGEKFRKVDIKREKAAPVCYYCGKEGHIKPQCPALKIKGANTMCCMPRPEIKQPQIGYQQVKGKMQTVNIVVNGTPATALLDTGSTQTLVMPYLVQSQQVGEGVVDVWCVHGDKKPYPTAHIHLEIQGQKFFLEVGVVPSLSHPVLVGQDVPILQNLIGESKPVNAVVTRSRAHWGEDDLHTEPSPLDQLPYNQSDIPIESNGKTKKSKNQRRRDKLVGTANKTPTTLPQPLQPGDEGWWELPKELKEIQKEDVTLQEAFRNAVGDGEQQRGANLLKPDCYFQKNGVLYHKSEGGTTEQLVVPQSLREQVLTLGHSIPWAGHLGKIKTLERIAHKFYWPGLYTDVQKYCLSCPICQLTSNKKSKQFP